MNTPAPPIMRLSASWCHFQLVVSLGDRFCLSRKWTVFRAQLLLGGQAFSHCEHIHDGSTPSQAFNQDLGNWMNAFCSQVEIEQCAQDNSHP